MQAIPISTLFPMVVGLLKEMYEGVPASQPTWVIDSGPGSGILAAVRELTAAEASTSIDGSGSRGTTIAAHIEHLHWSLVNVNEALRGKEYSSNWSESWNLIDANPAAWDELREALRREYETLRDTLLIMFSSAGSPVELEDDYITGLLALVPHAAYHLAAILQMIERVREKTA